jgi:diaminopimelate decarboxylase
LNAHLHYSAKANANLSILRALIGAGAGIDAVSGGEIFRALKAGAKAADVVYAGVGKTAAELRYAVEQGVGWFNVENIDELALLDGIAADLGTTARVALRLNPDVVANTHKNISTGHRAAKFGLPAPVVTDVLDNAGAYPHLRLEGIHIHIGSQLHDVEPTLRAVRAALDVIAPYESVRVVNIGGGIPVPYEASDNLPSVEDFAVNLIPLLKGYEVLLEPGRSIIADAGALITDVVYVKEQGGQTFVVCDAGMTDLIRPALYEAHHAIIRVRHADGKGAAQVVGPVCEATDTLGHDVPILPISTGERLAVLTAGAYGMAMASNYNARPRPAEVVVTEDGEEWKIARRRESWADLIAAEVDLEET